MSHWSKEAAEKLKPILLARVVVNKDKPMASLAVSGWQHPESFRCASEDTQSMDGFGLTDP